MNLFWVVLVAVPTAMVGFQSEEPAKEEEAPKVAKVMDSRTAGVVAIDEIVPELTQQDVIVLGEQHDNDSGHAFQFDLIRALTEAGTRVVISTEQFERDVQGVVDDYLAGRIDEDTFLKHSRPWRNYKEHYRPIIEFAKENHLPVLAGNVPRRLASQLSKGETVAVADQPFLARSTSTPMDEYWSRFNDSMKNHIGADGASKIKAFYASQCAKDDAMAESITDYLATNQHQHKVVVHLCGHFHSDYGLGTVARVKERMPLARIAVFTMEAVPDDGKLELDDARNRSHYVVWTVPNAKPEDTEDEED